MSMLLAALLACSACTADRIAALEEAGMAAVREINGAVYTIENREDGGPVDDALVGRLSAASDALYEVVSEEQFVCDDRPERCGVGTYPAVAEQPWSCEDYLANDETPVEGCKREGRRDTRATLCRGPVAVIADDDPGLALFADALDLSVPEDLEEAKVQLAFERGETCDDSEQNIPAGASVSTIAVEHICSDDEKGCAVPRRATGRHEEPQP